MILVTGASGTNGSELIKLLSERGVSVRGMVRRPRTHNDTALSNVEYITADFDDAASLHRALVGVERVFLVTNSTERVEEQQLRFVEIASAAGVRRVVYLSQLHSAKDSPVRFLRYHAVVEEAIASSVMESLHTYGLISTCKVCLAFALRSRRRVGSVRRSVTHG